VSAFGCSTIRTSDPASHPCADGPDSWTLDEAPDRPVTLTSNDESRRLPAAPVRRVGNELGHRPLPFESPADGTEELLGRGRQRPQSITSEGAVGQPVETCLVLPRVTASRGR
jgi:hypothetical protein